MYCAVSQWFTTAGIVRSSVMSSDISRAYDYPSVIAVVAWDAIYEQWVSMCPQMQQT